MKIWQYFLAMWKIVYSYNLKLLHATCTRCSIVWWFIGVGIIEVGTLMLAGRHIKWFLIKLHLNKLLSSMSRLLFEFKHEIVRQYPQITANFSPAFQHPQDNMVHPFLQLHHSKKSNFQISKKYYQNFQWIVIYSQSSRVMKLKKTIFHNSFRNSETFFSILCQITAAELEEIKNNVTILISSLCYKLNFCYLINVYPVGNIC